MVVAAYADTMSESHSNLTADASARVSETLKVAFDAVTTATLDVEEKGRWQRRLIAITNTSKHDVVRAQEQLQRFKEEWNALHAGKEILQ
jgi:hypothetical protein